jgi:hypothetical protein
LRYLYQPVYLGNSLFKFISNIDGFGNIDPLDNISLTPKLIDLLPCLKSGIVLRSGIVILFQIYFNNLRNIEDENFFHFDDHMIEVFINKPAEFYHDNLMISIVYHHLSTILNY